MVDNSTGVHACGKPDSVAASRRFVLSEVIVDDLERRTFSCAAASRVWAGVGAPGRVRGGAERIVDDKPTGKSRGVEAAEAAEAAATVLERVAGTLGEGVDSDGEVGDVDDAEAGVVDAVLARVGTAGVMATAGWLTGPVARGGFGRTLRAKRPTVAANVTDDDADAAVATQMTVPAACDG